MSEQTSRPQPTQPRIPRATYRLQMHPGFTFVHAERTLDYLTRLGISDAYLSPVWQAAPGSTHGYDVTDHSRVNPELGGLGGFNRFSDALREHGLGLLLDFVPNHMGVGGGHNAYWEDVLEHGQASRYAHFFDIDWEPLKRSLAGKVLLPVLGDLYGRVLEQGQLKAVRPDGEDRSAGAEKGAEWTGKFALRYFDRQFPLSPRTQAGLLHRAAELCKLSEENDLRGELYSLAVQAGHLPRSSGNLSDTERTERARETAVIARRLQALVGQSPAIPLALDAAVRELNADQDALDRLIREQNYRLSYWRVASEQINYRRFFDINDLAALRMEDPRVFAWAHAQLFELVGQGRVDGVRLDHTDGLYDPAGYFEQLQGWAGAALERPASPLPLYVVAEKILEPGEALPARWPIHGTTGYDFLAQLGGTFVDERFEDEMTAIYRRFTGDRLSYGEILHDTKELILRGSLSSELSGLSERLERLAERDLRWRDFTLSTLRAALREVIACFPVYRTYLRADGEREPGDDAKIGRAIDDARRLNRELDPSVFDFLQSVLTVGTDAALSAQAYAEFAMSFQQLTGPVTAKGAEDTAFYRYVRLLSLNEVGGDPALYGTPPGTFHSQALARAKHWPHAMLTTSTHDTKRGEDTRARISVLSEMPQTWAAYLSIWSRLSRPFEQVQPAGGSQTAGIQAARAPQRWPSFSDGYALFQTALGAWPLEGLPDDAALQDFQDRLTDSAHKAAREAKVHTTWASPDTLYEDQLATFIGGLLKNAEFRGSMEELHGRVSSYGAQNSLSTALVKLTAPGVPDTYQGSESWNQSLVDPDNRRPVDYTGLSKRLVKLETEYAEDPLALAVRTLETYQTGDVKLLTTWAALQARKAAPELFAQGDYHATEAGRFLLAFSRTLSDQVAVVAAPRLSYTLTREKRPWALGEVWGSRELTLPRPGTYRNVLTGEVFEVREKLALAALFAHFPLALLLLESR